jgi:hypothetical protein
MSSEFCQQNEAWIESERAIDAVPGEQAQRPLIPGKPACTHGKHADRTGFHPLAKRSLQPKISPVLEH